MQRFDLNQNWEYLESSLQNPLMVGMLQGWKKTSLPHDYAVEKARSPEAATGLDEGFMACAGLYYRKSFTVEPEIIGQRFWLEFALPRSRCTKSRLPSTTTPIPASGWR